MCVVYLSHADRDQGFDLMEYHGLVGELDQRFGPAQRQRPETRAVAADQYQRFGLGHSRARINRTVGAGRGAPSSWGSPLRRTGGGRSNGVHGCHVERAAPYTRRPRQAVPRTPSIGGGGKGRTRSNRTVPRDDSTTYPTIAAAATTSGRFSRCYVPGGEQLSGVSSGPQYVTRRRNAANVDADGRYHETRHHVGLSGPTTRRRG